MPDVSYPNPDAKPKKNIEGLELDDTAIVKILDGYKVEMEFGRESGSGNRDQVWSNNVDQVWNRYDFEGKEDWQAQETMPEAPQFVNRWASSMVEGLVRDGEFYTVDHPEDDKKLLEGAIKKALNYWLSRCHRTPLGHPVEFVAVFEDLMKLGAMMNLCAAVTWKERDGAGYVSVQPVDPREVWLDPTGRGQYRRKKTMIDRHELDAKKDQKDADGKPIYKKDVIEKLQHQIDDDQQKKEKLAGHNKHQTSSRVPVVLDEYLCNIVNNEGKLVHQNVLCVVANDKWLIRGPEKNPFWHEMDWLVYASAVTVPLSVYGKTYMEDWSGLMNTFVHLTNLILDGVNTSVMNAYVANPFALEDPNQIKEGFYPNIILYGDEDEDIANIIKEVELGKLPVEAVTIWQAIKKELQEGAAFSELSLGQLSRGEKTATEVGVSERGSNQSRKANARSIETNFLEVILNLMWKTGLQHFDENDREMKSVVGEANFKMLMKNRQEFIKRNITFRVNAISGLIERQEKLQKLFQVLQLASSNELFMKALLEKIPVDALFNQIMDLIGIDLSEFLPQGIDKDFKDAKDRLAQQEAARNENAPTSTQRGRQCKSRD